MPGRDIVYHQTPDIYPLIVGMDKPLYIPTSSGSKLLVVPGRRSIDLDVCP